jgi:transcription initiation factor TFIID subunit 10
MADAKPSADQLSQDVRDEDMDASIETEIIPETQVADSMNMDGANEPDPQASGSTVADIPVAQEARIPAKKDANLREFLGKMDDYAPIVCLTSYFPRNAYGAHRRAIEMKVLTI